MGKKRCTAIVLAAGGGSRMKSKIPKQFLLIKKKPVLYYSLACFQNTSIIDEIILVAGEEFIPYCREEIVDLYGFSKVKRIITGGKERYDSVYQGLLASKNCDYVFIHDGARPFITEEMLKRAMDAVEKYQACVVGMPSKDTIKIADNEGMVAETLDRNHVWTIQTPQVFDYSLIRRAHEIVRQGSMKNITDDAMVMEQAGLCKIKLVEGSYENIKITTPEDIEMVHHILSKM